MKEQNMPRAVNHSVNKFCFLYKLILFQTHYIHWKKKVNVKNPRGDNSWEILPIHWSPKLYNPTPKLMHLQSQPPSPAHPHPGYSPTLPTHHYFPLITQGFDSPDCCREEKKYWCKRICKIMKTDTCYDEQDNFKHYEEWRVG